MEDYDIFIDEDTIKEIADCIDKSVILCEHCKIADFCKGKEGECGDVWELYIKDFIDERKIANSMLVRIGDEIGLSMQECLNCQIKHFCTYCTDTTLCNCVWYRWLYDKVMF